MKLWIDDVRPEPKGYIWIKSVRLAKWAIEKYESMVRHGEEHNLRGKVVLEVIDIDHDAGDYANDGGDYIKLLDWLEETERNYPIRIHSMNPVGRENMRAIIRRNGWTEVM